MFGLFKKKSKPKFRRATLPLRRDEMTRDGLPATHVYDEDISRAVALLRANPDASMEEVYKQLVKSGTKADLAARLIEFLPVVYGRIILSTIGVRLSDKFRRVLPDGTVSPERRLAEEPLWLAATQFARAEVNRGVSPREIELVGGCSCEIAAANQVLQKGGDPKNVICVPPLFCWPEAGLPE